MAEGNWTRRRTLAAGTGAAVAAVLPSAARSAGAPSPAQLQANISCTDGDAEYILEALMKRQKYFEQAGVRPDLRVILGVPKLIKSVVSRETDICIASGISPVLAAIAKGSPLRIVAGSNLLPVDVLFSKFRQIRSVKDLVGKRVGSGPKGALLHQITFALLEKKGVDPSKVHFVDLGNSVSVFKAVVKGEVDAGIGEIDVYGQDRKYGVHALTDGVFWDELPDYTNQGSYASLDAIRDKREELIRVLAAYLRAYRFLDSPASKDAFAQARAAALKDADPAETATQWNFYQKYKPFSQDLLLSEKRLDYLQNLNVQMGLQDRVLPFDQVADMSLAREAAARLG